LNKLTINKIILSALIFALSPVLNAEPVFNKAWETTEDLKLPESVIYDDDNNILYVSSMQDDPFKKDGNGFISKVDLDGNIVELNWINGLNAPKGLAISKDKLYVGDVDQLVEIDIQQGKVINRYDAVGATLLNDVAADSKGNIYVSDTFTDTIYRLNTFGQLTTWLYSPELQAPNGLQVEKDQLIVGSWGLPTDGWMTDVAGHLKSVSLKTKEIKSLGNGNAVGNIDGVEPDGNGAYYVTDWVGGKLLHVQTDGSFKVALELSQGTADFEVIHTKNLIIIPMMLEGKLIAFQIK
jgi:sugar lactone lactonase YvrE